MCVREKFTTSSELLEKLKDTYDHFDPLSDGTPPPPPGNDNRHEDGDRRRPEAPPPRRRRENLRRGPIHQRLGPLAPVNDCGRGSANHSTSVAPEAPRSAEIETVQVPRATRSEEAATVQVPALDDEVFSAPLPVLELSALSGDVFRPAAVGVKSHGGEAEAKNCFHPEVASGLTSGARVQPPNSNEALLAVEVVGPLEWARQTLPQPSGPLMVPGPVSPHSCVIICWAVLFWMGRWNLVRWFGPSIPLLGRWN
jgi:hypothetical protein